MLMAAGKSGNLDQVRSALRRDLEVGDIVDYSPFNTAFAELVPNISPRWHIIETHPNGERTAAAHLIARRFGVFIPEVDETVIKRGRKIDRSRLMFSGYIFVFVWDVMRHMSRIETIPGIRRVMLSRIETRPAVFDEEGIETRPALFEDLPAVIGDEIIDQIRSVENKQRPLRASSISGGIGPLKKKRRWRKWLEQIEQSTDNDIVSVRPWSAFQDGLLSLDAAARNQTLLKALSLT